jgi:DNA-binding transcriptional LysR family regulator
VALPPPADSTPAVVRAHSQVEPHVFELNPGDRTRSLDLGLLDVGSSIGGRASADLDRVVLGESRGCVVCGPAHPLARQRRVTARQLSEHPWVVPRFLEQPLSPSIDQYPGAIAPRRIGPRIELLQAGVALAEAGVSLACFPEISIRRELRAGSLRELSGGPHIPPFELSVFTRRKTAPSPALEALVREMRALLVAAPRARRRGPASR